MNLTTVLVYTNIFCVLGRVSRSSPKSAPSTNATAQSRVNRRNTAKQTQTRKRQALIASTRIFSGTDGVPRIVAVVPLCSDVHSRDAVNALANPLDSDVEECPQSGTYRLKYKLTLASVRRIAKYSLCFCFSERSGSRRRFNSSYYHTETSTPH